MFSELVSCRIIKLIINYLSDKDIPYQYILDEEGYSLEFVNDYYNWCSLNLFSRLAKEVNISPELILEKNFSQDVFGADMSAVLRALGSPKPVFNHTDSLISYFVNQKVVLISSSDENNLYIKYIKTDPDIELLAEYISHILAFIPLLWGGRKFNIYKEEKTFKIENTNIPQLFQTKNSFNEYSPKLVNEIIQSLQQSRKEIESKNKELESKNKELSNANNRLQTEMQKQITSEKMRTLGVLATGIAHEINNPLGSVISNIEYSATILNNLDKEFKTKETSELLEVQVDIKDALYRIKNLVGDINMLAHSGEGEKTTHDIEPLITSATRIISHKINNIKIHRDFSHEGQISCSPPRITQVILNIMTNAIHAINSNGIENGKIFIKSMNKKDNIIIEIMNNGGAVPEKILGKLDEPFFTTKEPGVGIGLGLAIVKQIIDNHDAKIKFKNKKDNFIVELIFKKAVDVPEFVNI